MCGIGRGRLLGGGLFAAHHGTPPGDMMGHTPYQTWHMYYYYRPYQMSHVTDLEEQSIGSSADSLNAWDNRLFDRIADDYSQRFQEGEASRSDAMTQALEFVGRPDLTSYNALPQRIHTSEVDGPDESSSVEAEDGNPDLPSPSDLEPHVSDFFYDDSVNIAELQLINPAIPPRRQ